MDRPDINLLDKDAFAERVPHEWFTWLRHNAPVYRHPEPDGPGFWVLSKHADIKEVSRNPALFSSDVDNGGIVGLTEKERAPYVLMSKNAKSVPMMDPPEHAPYRAALERKFRPRHVASLEDQVRAVIAPVVEDAVARETVDFVKDVGGPIAVGVLGRLLGVQERDWPKLLDLANLAVGADDPEYAEPFAAALNKPSAIARELRRAIGELGFSGLRFLPMIWDATPTQRRTYLALYGGRGELQRYALDLARARRAQPQEDLITDLVHAQVDGRPMSDHHVMLWIELFLTAGHETTRTAMTHGLQALLADPEQYAALCEDPTLIPSAVEEILRWATPVQYFRRTAMDSIEIRGKRIGKGETVALWYLSGNRDEDVFEDPFRFDIRRDPNDHLAFGGGGPHFCLGNRLARLEIRVLLEELTRRVTRVEPRGEVVRLRSNQIHGIKRLPMALHAEARLDLEDMHV